MSIFAWVPTHFRPLLVTNFGSTPIPRLDYTDGTLIGSYPVNASRVGVFFDATQSRLQKHQGRLVAAVEYRPNSFPSCGNCDGFWKDGRPTPYEK
jgi:hypothetical protein